MLHVCVRTSTECVPCVIVCMPFAHLVSSTSTHRLGVNSTWVECPGAPSMWWPYPRARPPNRSFENFARVFRENSTDLARAFNGGPTDLGARRPIWSNRPSRPCGPLRARTAPRDTDPGPPHQGLASGVPHLALRARNKNRATATPPHTPDTHPVFRARPRPRTQEEKNAHPQ